MLVDDSILPLFLEFLQRQGAQNVLNFWLSAETFRLSSQDKNLFSYKSRLKLKRNQEFSGNTSAVNISNDLHKIERKRHSTLTENKSLQKNPSSDDSFDSLKSTSPESNLRVIEGASLPDLSTDTYALAPRNSKSLSKTPAILSSTSIETDNNFLYGSDQSNNPLVYNSTNSNLTSHSDSVNASPMISSVSAITAEHNTCADNSVSQRNSNSNDQSEYKPSEIHKNSDASVSNINKTSNTDASECNAQYLSRKQATGGPASAIRSELCDERRLQNDGSATEMVGFPETVVLRRQESSDTKERRRRSKGIL